MIRRISGEEKREEEEEAHIEEDANPEEVTEVDVVDKGVDNIRDGVDIRSQRPRDSVKKHSLDFHEAWN